MGPQAPDRQASAANQPDIVVDEEQKRAVVDVAILADSNIRKTEHVKYQGLKE